MNYKKIKSSNFIWTFILLSSILFYNCEKDKPPVVQKEDIVLGIYSETADQMLIPGTDTYIGVYSGNGGIIAEFDDDNNEKKEGGISKKATFSVDASKNQYAGWFIQYGQAGFPKSKDMSDFKNGKLIFWAKSPINLGIGIRSSNVNPGDETSNVMLNNCPAFQPDNEWHKICIPLSDFTGEYPKADLSKIVILFNVFSNTPSGGTEGVPKTCWFDDVGWEIRYNTEYDCP